MEERETTVRDRLVTIYWIELATLYHVTARYQYGLITTRQLVWVRNQ